MNVLRVAVAIVLVSTPLYAQPETHPLRYMRVHNGGELQFDITRTQIEKVPAWTPQDGTAPPLQIDAAVDLGLASVRARHPDFSTFELGLIEISRIHTPHPLPNRWAYFVRFTPVVDGNRVMGGTYVAAVLMDGTILEPVTIPQAKPR